MELIGVMILLKFLTDETKQTFKTVLVKLSLTV